MLASTNTAARACVYIAINDIKIYLNEKFDEFFGIDKKASEKVLPFEGVFVTSDFA